MRHTHSVIDHPSVRRDLASWIRAVRNNHKPSTRHIGYAAGELSGLHLMAITYCAVLSVYNPVPPSPASDTCPGEPSGDVVAGAPAQLDHP